MIMSSNLGKGLVDDSYIMYVQNLANPDLVETVKKRIREVKVSSIETLSLLEQ